MQIPREAVLLRIFFGERDKFQGVPLHEAIVLKAREMHLGGATVLRGHMGFGHSSRIHSTKFLRLSQDLPVVVEIVDSREKIDAFLPVLDGMMRSRHHRESRGSSIWDRGGPSVPGNSSCARNTRQSESLANPLN